MGVYYFISDVHLGLPVGDPRGRERAFVQLLERIPLSCSGVFLLGDIFDMWYEYKYVIPKGFTRVFGALSRLCDAGVPVHFFTGNHDMWTFGYLQDELGVQVHREPLYVCLNGKHFLLDHGDALGPIPKGYHLLRRVFSSRWAQLLFSCMHPRWGLGLAYAWSRKNRLAKGQKYTFKGDGEPLFRFVANYDKPLDYCIVGHYHSPTSCDLPNGGKLIILSDWVWPSSFAGKTSGPYIGVFGHTKEGGVEIVEPSVAVH